MAKVKVRCPGCGKVNRDELAERCIVCGTMLGDTERIQAAKQGISQGPAFNELVENEVAAWQEYASGRNRPGAISRRPAELDEPKASRLPWRREPEDDP
jgi:DNA-directed RNA polymerase subunit N (RpoN/RPB10)